VDQKVVKLSKKNMEEITLTEEEREALRAYFDEVTINISSLIKKIGLENVKLLTATIDKIYGN
jgi:hypothetical protein